MLLFPRSCRFVFVIRLLVLALLRSPKISRKVVGTQNGSHAIDLGVIGFHLAILLLRVVHYRLSSHSTYPIRLRSLRLLDNTMHSSVLPLSLTLYISKKCFFADS